MLQIQMQLREMSSNIELWHLLLLGSISNDVTLMHSLSHCSSTSGMRELIVLVSSSIFLAISAAVVGWPDTHYAIIIELFIQNDISEIENSESFEVAFRFDSLWCCLAHKYTQLWETFFSTVLGLKLKPTGNIIVKQTTVQSPKCSFYFSYVQLVRRILHNDLKFSWHFMIFNNFKIVTSTIELYVVRLSLKMFLKMCTAFK